MSNSTARIKVFDFFSGCGGASCGLHASGMDVVYGLDSDADAAATFQSNFPEAVFDLTDISTVSPQRIRSLMTSKGPGPTVFCGCPPCQPFTKQNTYKSPDDFRIRLLSEFGRLVAACQPDIVFVENVPGIRSFDAEYNPLKQFLKHLGSDYQITKDVIPVMKYGIPQTRRRFILLASRHGSIGLPPFTNGAGTPNPRYRTVRESIAHLPRLAAGEEHSEDPSHRAAQLSALNLARIRRTPEGGGHRAWPRHLRLACHARTAGYTDVYGRLAWDRPASGLTTRCISYSNGRFGHPDQDRALSIREAACLQTFPPNYVFKGSLGSMARQIGNAVPARLARILGEHVSAHLQRHVSAGTDG